MLSTMQGLVACSDLTAYAKFAAQKTEEEVFRLLSDYYEMIGDIIEPAQGRVIKFMGDGALMFFPAAEADAGVRALLELRRQGDAFLAARGASCRHHVRAHFGSVCLGPLGTRTDKRPDLLGATVNTTFLLKTTSAFALTPEAFRKLAPATRKLFKKHTPPIAYIPVAEPHRD